MGQEILFNDAHLSVTVYDNSIDGKGIETVVKMDQDVLCNNYLIRVVATGSNTVVTFCIRSNEIEQYKKKLTESINLKDYPEIARLAHQLSHLSVEESSPEYFTHLCDNTVKPVKVSGTKGIVVNVAFCFYPNA